MGCFTVLKCMKKKCDQTNLQRGSNNENVPTSRTFQYTPPSFRPSRMKSIHPINKLTNTRTRALSAPSALDAAEEETLASIEYEEQQNSKRRARSMKEQHSPSPQPLPLPTHPEGGAMKTIGSIKTRMATGPSYASVSAYDAAQQDALASVEYEELEGSKHQARSMKEQLSSSPKPLPLPSPQGCGPLKATGSNTAGTSIGSIRYFRYEEIVAACNDFSSDRCVAECLSSTIYKASFGDDASSSKMLEATVTLLHPSSQGLREFINEVNTLSSLQHPNLCKLLGFHARDGFVPRMLVYERLYHGSLDHMLFGRSDGLSIDWNIRMKIAICAAQGLTFLHEEGPFQAMYNEFSAANIQIDKDFNAKLSGYGCVGHVVEEEFSSNSSAARNLSVETLKTGMLTPKSNVWSFGIILLELLTGRKNYDNHLPKEERNLVKWCRPYLADDIRLSLIMDPQLKGCFPPKAARTVADIAQRCLQKEPSERPTMRAIVENLKMIQDMYKILSGGKHMARSPSVDGIISHAPPRFSFSFSPSVARTSISAPKWSVVPTVLPPPRACSSSFSMGELNGQDNKESSASVSRGAGVQLKDIEFL